MRTRERAYVISDYEYEYLRTLYVDNFQSQISPLLGKLNKQGVDIHFVSILDFMYENNLTNYEWCDIISLFLLAAEPHNTLP
jgi:hypothetical protein